MITGTQDFVYKGLVGFQTSQPTMGCVFPPSSSSVSSGLSLCRVWGMFLCSRFLRIKTSRTQDNDNMDIFPLRLSVSAPVHECGSRPGHQDITLRLSVSAPVDERGQDFQLVRH